MELVASEMSAPVEFASKKGLRAADLRGSGGMCRHGEWSRGWRSSLDGVADSLGEDGESFVGRFEASAGERLDSVDCARDFLCGVAGERDGWCPAREPIEGEPWGEDLCADGVSKKAGVKFSDIVADLSLEVCGPITHARV